MSSCHASSMATSYLCLLREIIWLFVIVILTHVAKILKDTFEKDLFFLAEVVWLLNNANTLFGVLALFSFPFTNMVLISYQCPLEAQHQSDLQNGSWSSRILAAVVPAGKYISDRTVQKRCSFYKMCDTFFSSPFNSFWGFLFYP